jgi:hypothetical protein
VRSSSVTITTQSFPTVSSVPDHPLFFFSFLARWRYSLKPYFMFVGSGCPQTSWNLFFYRKLNLSRVKISDKPRSSTRKLPSGSLGTFVEAGTRSTVGIGEPPQLISQSPLRNNNVHLPQSSTSWRSILPSHTPSRRLGTVNVFVLGGSLAMGNSWPKSCRTDN